MKVKDVRQRTLKARLLSLYIILFALFAAVSGTSYLLFIKFGSVHQAQMDMNRSFDLHERSVEEWFDHKAAFIETLSSLQSFKRRDHGPAIQGNLTALYKLHQEFSQLIFIGPGGRTEAAAGEQVGEDYSGFAFMKEVRQGKPHISEITKVKPDGERGIIFASPVMDEGQFVGVLAGIVDLDTVTAMVNTHRFGETGRIYLVDREGHAVTGDSMTVLFQSSPLYQAAVQGKRLSDFYLDTRGRMAYGDYRSVVGGAYMILGEIERSEVMHPVYNVGQIALGCVAMIFVLCIVGLLWFTRRMGATLGMLAESARAVREGDYSLSRTVPKPMFRSSETDEIMETFKQMTETVARQMGELLELNRENQESEERYRLISESSPDGIIIHSRGRIIWINRMGVTLLGAESPEDLIGKPAMSIIHESSLDQVHKRISELQESRHMMKPEPRKYVRMDGTVIDVESTAAFLVMNGQPSIMTVFRDMTERRRLEAAARDSEEKYRLISDHVSDMVGVLDRDGRLIYSSPSHETELGLSASQLVGKSPLERVHPDDQDTLTSQYRRMLETGEPIVVEYRCKHHDGSWVDLEMKATPVVEADGMIRNVVAVSRDIRERKQARLALEQSEELHRFIAENSTDMIARVDCSLIYRYVSQACLSILGYEQGEMVGRSLLDFIHPDYHAPILRHQRKLQEVRCGDSFPHYLTLRYLFVKRDGTTIWLETSARAIMDEEGRFAEIVAVSRDITERIKLERDMQETNTRMSEILASITDGFFALDQDWRFTYVNRTSELIMGKTAEELIGRVIWEVFPRVMETRVYQEYIRAVRDQISAVSEDYYSYLNAWYETRVYPGKNGVSVYIRDITARKQLEEELQVNQEHLTRMLETVPSAIMLMDNEGRFTYANKRAEELFGLSREVILKRTYCDPEWRMYTLEGEPYPNEEMPYRRVAATLQPINQIEMEHEREDGARLVLSCNSTPVFGPDNELGSVLVSVTDITESKKLELELQKLSSMDGLTGIANRRSFNETMSREWQRGARLSKPLSMIMLDVDYFKVYNDTYGHQAGDECLKVVASVLNSSLYRGGDQAFRYGGEEFAVILPDTDLPGACMVAEHIRSAIEERAIPHEGSPKKVLTCSLGIASIVPTPLSEPEMLLAKADMALYRAKQCGRNQVQTSGGAA